MTHSPPVKCTYMCETPHRTYASIVTGTRVTSSVDDSEFFKAADILSSLSQVDQPVYIMLLLHKFTLSFHSVLSLSGSFMSGRSGDLSMIRYCSLFFNMSDLSFSNENVQKPPSAPDRPLKVTQNCMPDLYIASSSWEYRLHVIISRDPRMHAIITMIWYCVPMVTGARYGLSLSNWGWMPFTATPCGISSCLLNRAWYLSTKCIYILPKLFFSFCAFEYDSFHCPYGCCIQGFFPATF